MKIPNNYNKLLTFIKDNNNFETEELLQLTYNINILSDNDKKKFIQAIEIKNEYNIEDWKQCSIGFLKRKLKSFKKNKKKNKKKFQDIKFDTEKQILLHAKKLEGKTFLEINKEFRNIDINNTTNRKGKPGQLIEQYFCIKTNNKSTPDFESLGIELKLTPLKRVYKNFIVPKERLVISMINYKELIECKNIYETHLYKKIKKILIIYYLHESEKKFEDFIIQKVFLFEPFKDENFTKAIINDFNQMKLETQNGHLKQNSKRFITTCPKHGGGWKKRKKGSLAKHPIQNIVEKRGYCFNAPTMKKIIAKVLNIPLEKKGLPIKYFI